MDIKTVDIGRACCQAPHDKAAPETKIQPIFKPVQNPDLIGALHHFPGVPSKFITPRNVDIWLPPDYDKSKAGRYAVLYMHDGQNLFEPQKSYIGVDWGMDETMARLCGEKKIMQTIVVGIWNTPQRLREYLPQRPFYDHRFEHSRPRVIKRYGGMPISDNYLRFLVCELKPFVDERYRTRPQREFTFMMGSSMGGLISLYALCEYPQVFGGAACLSTHWPVAPRYFGKYLKARLPEPKDHKIYLDYGDEANINGYLGKQTLVEHLIKQRGYRSGSNWLARWYTGEPHSETAWRGRVHVPLQFLLKNTPNDRSIAKGVTHVS